MQDVPAWAALVTTLIGGAGVKVLDKFLFTRRKNKEQEIDFAEMIRKELREELADLKSEIKAVEDDLDKWKSRYYDLRNAYNTVKARCKELHVQVVFLQQNMRSPKPNEHPDMSDTFAALKFDDASLDRIDEEIVEEDKRKGRAENGDEE